MEEELYLCEVFPNENSHSFYLIKCQSLSIGVWLFALSLWIHCLLNPVVKNADFQLRHITKLYFPGSEEFCLQCTFKCRSTGKVVAYLNMNLKCAIKRKIISQKHTSKGKPLFNCHSRKLSIIISLSIVTNHLNPFTTNLPISSIISAPTHKSGGTGKKIEN